MQKQGPGKEAALRQTDRKQHGVSPLILAQTSEHLGSIFMGLQVPDPRIHGASQIEQNHEI